MRIKTCDEVLNKLLEIGDSVDNPADIDVYWKFTDKANLEYARKRGVSEYITFAGLGRVNNKRWPTGAREGSKNAERGSYTPKSLASLCKFLEREFKDCGDCLFVSGDGRALNDIVVENGKVVLIFGRATGCFTRESVENEETEMKKLNITKEQFNRSRYFKNKYGELEYVSESGKMFKTDKGRVLMFKESTEDLKDLIDDIFDDGLYEDGKKAQILLPQLETKLNGLGLLEDENVKDYFDEFADTIKICLKSSRIQNFYRDTAYKLADGLKYSIDSALGYTESTRKFGKKFNESYDSDAAKEKFFDVLTDELGISEDGFENFVEGLDENYDLMNDIMMKLLDGKPLDRMEQIQTAYYLCDKLENHF